MNFMGKVITRPIIVDLPYGENDEAAFRKALARRYPTHVLRPGKESSLEPVAMMLRYVIAYPTVYVVYSGRTDKYSHRCKYVAYVGETNDIRHRTLQHLKDDPRKRKDWEAIAEVVRHNPDAYHQYVISHPYFNKSLTLDVENRLMHYLSSVDSVAKLNNRRTNAQGDYYTSDRFDSIFSQIWLDLHRSDPELFPAEEIIRDSALFKASPFHRLSPEQVDAEEAVFDCLVPLFDESKKRGDSDEQDGPTRLVFVQGAAGTGKTVLLSHLFYRIATELQVNGGSSEPSVIARPQSYIVVNHKEQVHVYNQIATKLGLQKKSGDVVMLPSQFINRFSETNEYGRGIPDKPRGKAGIVLIDEAHLLATQGNQGYSGKNQLYDIIQRAQVVIAVFDSHQILQARQQWHLETMERLGLLHSNETFTRGKGLEEFRELTLGAEEGLPPISVDVANIKLGKQFRMAADEATIQWIDDFATGKRITSLPVDPGEYDEQNGCLRAPYEVKVFDSPIALYDAIRRKAAEPSDGWKGVGLSRLLATYDWPYSSASKNENDADGHWNVELHRKPVGEWAMGLPDDGTPAETFCKPWNYQLPDPAAKRFDKDLAWAEKPYTINEIGSIFTIQGFDLNYAGVIIGPSVQYRNGCIVFDKSASKNYLATNKRRDLGDSSQENLRNELNVLLKRGVHGLYLFAVDAQLQRRLKECCGGAEG